MDILYLLLDLTEHKIRLFPEAQQDACILLTYVERLR